MKALVQSDGRIAEIVTDADQFPIAAPLQWVDAPAGVTMDYAYSGGSFAAPAAPPAPAPLLSKLVISRRLTDSEVALVTGLAAGTVAEKRFWIEWVGAQMIDAGDAATVAGFEAVFGAARAAQLLAAA